MMLGTKPSNWHKIRPPLSIRLPMPTSLHPNSPIILYQQLVQLSNQIVENIRQQQWVTAAELCHVYSDILELLKTLPHLTREQRKKRRAFLSTILNNDAEIRAYLNPQRQAINCIHNASISNAYPMQTGLH